VTVQPYLTAAVAALSRCGLFHVQAFFFLSWDPFGRKDVQASSSDRGGKSSSCVAVLVFAWLPCTVIRIPPASPSRDDTVSPLNNAGRYGSLSLFVNTVMLLHLCFCFSRRTGWRPIGNDCWNCHSRCRHTDTIVLLLVGKGGGLCPHRVLWCQSWLTLCGRFPLFPSPEKPLVPVARTLIFHSGASSSFVRSRADSLATCVLRRHIVSM